MHQLPSTVFERPQAHLLPDTSGGRWYGNVSNLMEVAGDGFSFGVHVAVPTVLFTYMQEVAKVPPEVSVTLAIDRQGDWWVFSLLAGEDLHDLWAYSDGSIPAWILRDKSARA